MTFVLNYAPRRGASLSRLRGGSGVSAILLVWEIHPVICASTSPSGRGNFQ